MTHTVFIDGEAGTTGLQIRARLENRRDLTLLSIDPARRKEAALRAELLNDADVVVLCLPDDAAREAVSLIENPAVKVIDASTAHRVAPGWVYGFPEYEPGQRAAIAAAGRVTNPGCWSTGTIALLRPLLRAGLVPADFPISINGISGYSGGGRSMIEEFEDATRDDHSTDPYRIYAMDLQHKHLPEIQARVGLAHPPLFAPAVGRYLKGMIVEVPLALWALPGRPSLGALHEVLAQAYAGERFVEVADLDTAHDLKSLNPEGLNGTNRMRLYVFGNEGNQQARLAALLDNLGKGASGAAVQNLNIMLGLDEAEGLAD
jgi:N-acetyl-gamma-glutamyl-phosphate reductase